MISAEHIAEAATAASSTAAAPQEIIEAARSRLRVAGTELKSIILSLQTVQHGLSGIHEDIFSALRTLPAASPEAREIEQIYIEFCRAMLRVGGGFDLTLVSQRMQQAGKDKV